MANWPENGTENWNTEMLSFTGVEHNSDGTHDLSTIGWTETAVITKDLSDTDGTTDTVSSLSFQPRLVMFFAGVSEKNTASWGADDGTTASVLAQRNNNNMVANTSKSIWLVMASGAAIASGEITSISSTGFTLTWAKSGSPSGTVTIIALCFK